MRAAGPAAWAALAILDLANSNLNAPLARLRLFSGHHPAGPLALREGCDAFPRFACAARCSYCPRKISRRFMCGRLCGLHAKSIANIGSSLTILVHLSSLHLFVLFEAIN